jgi:hypothetical protein
MQKVRNQTIFQQMCSIMVEPDTPRQVRVRPHDRKAGAFVMPGPSKNSPISQLNNLVFRSWRYARLMAGRGFIHGDCLGLTWTRPA